MLHYYCCTYTSSSIEPKIGPCSGAATRRAAQGASAGGLPFRQQRADGGEVNNRGFSCGSVWRFVRCESWLLCRARAVCAIIDQNCAAPTQAALLAGESVTRAARNRQAFQPRPRRHHVLSIQRAQQALSRLCAAVESTQAQQAQLEDQ